MAIAGADALGVGRDLRVTPGPDVSASIEFYGDPAKVSTQDPRAADPARAVAQGNFKLVDQSGRLELFDLRVDPEERVDRSRDEPERVAELEHLLPELRFSEAGNAPVEDLSPETIRQLRELGYGQ